MSALRPRPVHSPLDAARRVSGLAMDIAPEHPREGAALLRVAADLFNAAGKFEEARHCGKAAGAVTRLARGPRSRPGLRRTAGGGA